MSLIFFKMLVRVFRMLRFYMNMLFGVVYNIISFFYLRFEFLFYVFGYFFWSGVYRLYKVVRGFDF